MSTRTNGVRWDVVKEILNLSKDIRAAEGVSGGEARRDMERYDLPYLREKLKELKKMKEPSLLQKITSALRTSTTVRGTLG